MPNPSHLRNLRQGQGGADHRACSKALQAQHLASKKKPAPRRMVKNHIDYLSETK